MKFKNELVTSVTSSKKIKTTSKTASTTLADENLSLEETTTFITSWLF